MNCRGIVTRLERFAPLKYAESWDNTGLLVEPVDSTAVVKNMLLTNDLTEAVLDEALTRNVNFILSYHPPIFKPLKSITQNHWKERIASRCLCSSIAVYSPHTAYDALKGGVNDWLASAFGPSELSPVTPSVDRAPFSHQISLLGDIDDDKFKDLVGEISSTLGNSPHFVNMQTRTVYCSQNKLASILSVCTSNDSITLSISKCENQPLLETGMGRLVTLESKQTIGDVIASTKSMTGLKVVRLALAAGHSREQTVVKRGAVCAGSGASLLRSLAGKVDLIITGEMGHHDVLEFAQCGTSVILLEHSNSERGFLSAVLQPKLTELFDREVNVMVSEKDCDPLQFI